MTASGAPQPITVVVTLYNKQPFIRDTVESVLAQDHPRYEVIIVDDGSTDDGVAAIADLLGDHVRLVRQSNQGPGPARNRGAEEAESDWIAFLDGDDLWLPDHLSTLAAIVERFPEAAAATTGFRRAASGTIAGNRTRDTAVDGYLLDYFREGLRREPMWTSCVAMKRRILLDMGGFGAFWPGEDLDMWVRLALDHPIAASDRQTAIYSIGTGGLMDVWERRPKQGFKPQPALAALATAIADPKHAQRRTKISAYRNHLLEMGARQALFRGESGVARQYLELLDPAQRSTLLALLARVPGPAALAVARGYSFGKRLLGRPRQ